MNFADYEIKFERIRRGANGGGSQSFYDLLLNEIEALSAKWGTRDCRLSMDDKAALNMRQMQHAGSELTRCIHLRYGWN